MPNLGQLEDLLAELGTVDGLSSIALTPLLVGPVELRRTNRAHRPESGLVLEKLPDWVRERAVFFERGATDVALGEVSFRVESTDPLECPIENPRELLL